MSFLENIKLQRMQSIFARRSVLDGNVYDRTSKKYSHPGSQKRHYRVYVPSGYSGKKPLPLVMVLHGCSQNHHDIQLVSDFDRLADRNNFIIVYPFVTHYNDVRGQNCWGWWRKEQIRPGRGEVEDLWQIVEEISSEFAIDRRRVHIAGLSSGGGMAVAALTVHAGRFASGASIAGVSYGESASAVAVPFPRMRRYRPLNKTIAMMDNARQNDRTPVPICIVHSHDDDTVDIQAGKNLRDSWLHYFGLEEKPVKSKKRHETQGVPWTHTRYGKRFGKSLVETIFLEGPNHGWYGGRAGRFSFPTAPHISELLWDFFKQHTC